MYPPVWFYGHVKWRHVLLSLPIKNSILVVEVGELTRLPHTLGLNYNLLTTETN